MLYVAVSRTLESSSWYASSDPISEVTHPMRDPHLSYDLARIVPACDYSYESLRARYEFITALGDDSITQATPELHDSYDCSASYRSCLSDMSCISSVYVHHGAYHPSPAPSSYTFHDVSRPLPALAMLLLSSSIHDPLRGSSPSYFKSEVPTASFPIDAYVDAPFSESSTCRSSRISHCSIYQRCFSFLTYPSSALRMSSIVCHDLLAKSLTRLVMSIRTVCLDWFNHSCSHRTYVSAHVPQHLSILRYALKCSQLNSNHLRRYNSTIQLSSTFKCNRRCGACPIPASHSRLQDTLGLNTKFNPNFNALTNEYCRFL